MRGFQRFVAGLTLVALVISLCAFVPMKAKAEVQTVATMSGLPETLLPGEQATVTLSLQNTPSMEFAMVQLELGEGLTLVSATWLVDGLMKDFDMSTNIGVLAFSGAKTMDGDVVTFVVEGAAAGEQTIKAGFEFRVGANTIGTTDVTETVTVPERKTASGTFSGLSSQLGVDETATITVNLQDMPDVEFALAQITLGDGLELVSATWLVEGVIKDIDLGRLRGALAMENVANINGDVFRFVVRGTQAGLDQMVKIHFSFKVGTSEVCTAEVNQSVDVVDLKTISFLTEDGSVFHQVTVGPNDPIEMPEGPAKAADNTYTYAFKEWVQVDETTYKASYTATYIDYTVIFKNEDGSVISEQTYHYGDPIVVPADPTKAADNTYTYTFAGWDNQVATTCAGSVTYTATYSKTYIDYTVIFKNEDGSVISEQTYHYGDTIVIPEAPTKEADDIYTYAFNGWSPAVSETCQGSATYTATYAATNVDYTVIFLAEDGTELSKATYRWGDTIVVPEAPAKAADNTYTYTFAGWSPDFSATCAGSVTYTATYTATYIDYTVIFKNEDGSVISEQTYHYGDTIVVPANPTKAADNTYTYAFAGWDAEVSATCQGSVTYTATYSKTYIDYTVIFKNEDGSVISQQTYHYGDPIVVPADPTKAADNTYTYAFAGWSPAVSETCAGDATYIATYSMTYIEYTVTFLDYNGDVLGSGTYHYGDEVAVPANPTRGADNTYTYAFAGWTPAVSATCAGNATYNATYTATYIEYTVTFQYADGSVIETKTYHYGDAVAAPEFDVEDGYEFVGWDKNITNCDGNATYTAIVILIGDLNGDGEVSGADAIYLLYYTFLPAGYPVNQNCDFNKDNNVTDADAAYLLYYTFEEVRHEYPLR